MTEILTEILTEGVPDTSIDASLRRLYYLASDADRTIDEKAQELLELGCSTLGLSLGIVSRVQDGRYEVRYSAGLELDPPEPGTIFEVSGTYCCHTLAAEDVTSFHHAGKSEIAEHPCYLDFGLEAYIGAPLIVHGQAIGTLNFSDPAARQRPFSIKEVELVRFFGKWLSKEWQLEVEKQELLDTSALLKAVIQAMPDALIVADRERRITLTNEAFGKTFGYRTQELAGRQTSVLYADLDQYDSTGQRRFNPGANGVGDPYEMTYRRRDGEAFTGETHAAPLTTQDGRRLGYLAVIRDLTRRKAIEAQRDHAISVVSHEIKTPVSVVSGALQLLGNYAHKLPEEGQHLITMAENGMTRTESLIEDILTSGRLQAEDGQSPFEEADLAVVLKQAIQGIQLFADTNDVSLDFVGAEGGGAEVFVNISRVQQVVTNLLSNAIKASPKHGRVKVGLVTNPAGFWISDNGPGIPEMLQPVLYDRFTRSGEESFRFGGGTGLGMSVVKAIVDQHRGEITFDTSKSAGTTFVVRFPNLSAEATPGAEVIDLPGVSAE
ncbi:ATP-binding protein [Roseivivax sp. GX 12232]|uniref:ATP-binding protein n=1 Tax=Roseivivax sp. GX 12232 TaxID=2900547 RepID=UPI001E293D60|nr:ATP-binding protein [Roseivivax sp. GX 12232]MCE0506130.1 ATP-binding protein [Roseivivax sp. GX 12232]